MNRKCAWCGKILSGEEAQAAEGRDITHGVCGDCIDNIELHDGVDFSRFIDSLNAPVIVQNESRNVHDLNRAASRLLGVEQTSFTPRTPGLVFECEHARNPEGCQRTIHCSGCTIRMAIEQTATTGRSVIRQPATLKQDDAEVSLTITTEKLGTMILLKIDEMTKTQKGGSDVQQPT